MGFVDEGKRLLIGQRLQALANQTDAHLDLVYARKALKERLEVRRALHRSRFPLNA
jgi:hypothetical protein